MGYTHLTIDERERIAQYRAAGQSVTAVALLLGRAVSTVYTELARNKERTGHYSPSAAQAAYQARREASARAPRLEQDPWLRQAVADSLAATWSPEQIAGRLTVEHPADPARRVGFKTIYRWIARDRAAGGTLFEHLRRRGRRYMKRYAGRGGRGRIVGRRPLSERPPVADRRDRLGDFEGDTVCVGRAAAIATHVDRKSRFLVAAPLADGRAATMNRATMLAFAEIPATKRRTLTVDNGHEFAAHKKLAAKLGLSVYFAPPYQSWRRGTNENTNGLLREFFPKRSRQRPTRKQLDRAVALLNDRPRKCNGWRTPAEVFHFKSRFRFQFH